MSTRFQQLNVSPAVSFTELIHQPDFQHQLCQLALPSFLPTQRWFTSKGKVLEKCLISHAFSINEYSAILLCEVTFADGTMEMYQLPLAWNTEPEWLDFFQEFNTHHVIAQVGEPAVALLTDAIPRANFRHLLFTEMQEAKDRTDALTYDKGKLINQASGEVTSIVPAIDTSNTAIIYNDQFFFKLFRKLDPGLNPDLELVRFLSEKTTFKNSPAYGGSLTVGKLTDVNSINLGLMIGKIDNQGDAWAFFQELTEEYYTAIVHGRLAQQLPPPLKATSNYADLDATTQRVFSATTFQRAQLLGQRTGEMHLALASAGPELPDLFPEPLTATYREEIYLAAKKLLDRQFAELSQKLNQLSDSQRQEAQNVLDQRDLIERRLQALRDQDISVDLTRIHADYHLGQVLCTEDDFYIIDFEGEPLLTIPERRRKRPPFKDVAGMVRSFHYAAQGQLLLNHKYTEENRQQLTAWGEYWFRLVRQLFLDAYLATTKGATFVPATAVQQQDLLNFFVLEKAIYEVAYELNSRPDWLAIPLRGVLFALNNSQA